LVARQLPAIRFDHESVCVPVPAEAHTVGVSQGRANAHAAAMQAAPGGRRVRWPQPWHKRLPDSRQPGQPGTGHTP